MSVPHSPDPSADPSAALSAAPARRFKLDIRPAGISFIEGIKKPYTHLVSKLPGENDLSYIPWMSAIALAEHPAVELRPDAVSGRPFHVLATLSGERSAFVMVGDPYGGQTVMSPIRNARQELADPDHINSAMINHAMVRGFAKFCAVRHGIGLGLWLEGIRTPSNLLGELGVSPTTALHEIEPMVRKTQNGHDYVPWVAAWAAARIVAYGPKGLMGQTQSTIYGGPLADRVAFEVDPVPVDLGNSFGVRIRFGIYGVDFREYFYPILGEVLDGEGRPALLPLSDPDADDMNRAAMRALARAVAMSTGYGASVYAGEDLEALNVQAPVRSIARKDALGRNFHVPKTSEEARKASDRHEETRMSAHMQQIANEAKDIDPAIRLRIIEGIRERISRSNKGARVDDASIVDQVNEFYKNSPGSHNEPLVKVSQASLLSGFSLDNLETANLLLIRAVIGSPS